MNEKNADVLFENLVDVLNGGIGAMTEFALTLFEETKGDLKDCLNYYNLEQLEVIVKFNNQLKNLRVDKSNKKGIVKKLEKRIKEIFGGGQLEITLNELEELEKLMNNDNYQIKSDLLVGLGIVYTVVIDGKRKYYIPEDIRKIVKEKYTSDIKEEIIKNELSIILVSAFYIYGLIPIELIKKIVKEKYPQVKDVHYLLGKIDNFTKVDIDNNEYYVIKEFAEIANEFESSKEYADISCEEMIFYFNTLLNFAYEVARILNQKEEEVPTILYELVSSLSSVEEKVKTFEHIYSLSKKRKENLYSLLLSFNHIRYWSLGGMTIDESKLNDFVLSKKPVKTDLKSQLEALDKKALNYLYQKYKVNIISDLRDKIIDGFAKEDLTTDDKNIILENQNNDYDNIMIDASEITDGYYYLYKEKNKLKVFIPDEIVSILETSLENQIDLIESYLLLNGAIKKTDLQKILKEKHNLDYTLPELDKKVLNNNRYIIGDYYFLVNDLSKVEQSLIINSKSIIPFKKVDNNIRAVYELIDKLHNEIMYHLIDVDYNVEKKKRFFGTIILLLHLEMFNKDAIKSLIETNNFKLDKYTFQKIVDCINKYKNDIPLWAFNGFSRRDLSNGLAKTKVGRNDPCPCGSGKKYKKCCGKNA